MFMGFFFVFSVVSNLCYCILIVFVCIVIILENLCYLMNYLDIELNLVVIFLVIYVCLCFYILFVLFLSFY